MQETISKDNVVIPSTDQQEFEDIVFRLADEKVETFKIQLTNCLPVPRQETSIKKIIQFKNKRADELRRFRKALKDIEQKLTSASTISEQKDIMYDFQEEIKNELRDIKKLLADAKLEHGFSSFSSLLDFTNKDLLPAAGSIAAASGGVVFNHPITGFVTGAIVLAGTFINSARKIKRSIDANSFSYLYQAKKAGVLKD